MTFSLNGNNTGLVGDSVLTEGRASERSKVSKDQALKKR